MHVSKKLKFKHLALASAMVFIVAGQPFAAYAEAFTAEQKAELTKMFDAYVMEHPETIMKSVEQFRMKQQEQSQQDAAGNLQKHKEYLIGKDMPMMGNPDGDVVMVEYFDFNCGYCKRMFDDLVTLVKEDKNIRVVLHDLPILSPASGIMAHYALAAHKQGKYFEMHQALMHHRGAQTDDAFLEIAKGLGLDLDKLKKDKDDPAIEEMLNKNRQIAGDLGIQGTPGIIIGDQIYRGYIGLDGVKQSIKEEREKAAKPAGEKSAEEKPAEAPKP